MSTTNKMIRRRIGVLVVAGAAAGLIGLAAAATASADPNPSIPVFPGNPIAPHVKGHPTPGNPGYRGPLPPGVGVELNPQPLPPGGGVELNPQPLPPKPNPGPERYIHPGIGVELNPQPLPPGPDPGPESAILPGF